MAPSPRNTFGPNASVSLTVRRLLSPLRGSLTGATMTQGSQTRLGLRSDRCSAAAVRPTTVPCYRLNTCDKNPFLYESQPMSKWFYAHLLREAIRPSPGWIFGSPD